MIWAEMDSRERDALVAEKVMGLTGCSSDGWRYEEGTGKLLGQIPEYSTEIGPAWDVLEEIVSMSSLPDGRSCDLCFKAGQSSDGVFAEIHEVSPMGYVGQDTKFDYICVSSWDDGVGLLPEAICLAALRAKGVEV